MTRAGDARDATTGFRVEREEERGIATITLDVPGKLNRLPLAARDQLGHLFAELGADDVRAIRRAHGRRARRSRPAATSPRSSKRSPEQLSRLAWNVAAPERCPKPVIAKLRGYCLGVGLELALACDFRVAADDVQLGLPEVGLGMIPGSGGTQRLARLVGLGRAKDVIMRRRRIAAADALAWGLVSEVVAAGGARRRRRPRDRRPGRALAARAADGEARPQPRLRRAARRSASRSRASPTACSARRTTSARASRRSARSARRGSKAVRDMPQGQSLEHDRDGLSTGGRVRGTVHAAGVVDSADPVRRAFLERRLAGLSAG